MTLEEIVTAKSQDSELQAVFKAVQSGQWFNKKDPNHRYVKTYQKLRNEFSVTDNGILLRDTRIVIPKSLRQRTMAISHEGHQGIAKTKTLLRTKVWWHGLDAEVEKIVKNCLPW